MATPLRLVDDEELPLRCAPARGEHTEEVLAELCGYSPGQVAELAGEGVFGAVELTAS